MLINQEFVEPSKDDTLSNALPLIQIDARLKFCFQQDYSLVDQPVNFQKLLSNS